MQRLKKKKILLEPANYLGFLMCGLVLLCISYITAVLQPREASRTQRVLHISRNVKRTILPTLCTHSHFFPTAAPTRRTFTDDILHLQLVLARAAIFDLVGGCTWLTLQIRVRGLISVCAPPCQDHLLLLQELMGTPHVPSDTHSLVERKHFLIFVI